MKDYSDCCPSKGCVMLLDEHTRCYARASNVECGELIVRLCLQFEYTSPPLSRQVKHLVHIILNTLQAHNHLCKNVTDPSVFGPVSSISRGNSSGESVGAIGRVRPDHVSTRVRMLKQSGAHALIMVQKSFDRCRPHEQRAQHRRLGWRPERCASERGQRRCGGCGSDTRQRSRKFK